MIIKLLKCCERKYLLFGFLAAVTIMGEVLLEICIPTLMATMVDQYIPQAQNGATEAIRQAALNDVIKTGCLMVVCALVSLMFGALSGKFAAMSAAGFAKGVRGAVFHKIQDFSFSNIDKFSTPSLITRLTTDISFLQNSFMMATRTMFRAPCMIVASVIAAFRLNKSISMVFLAVVPILAISLLIITLKAHPRFEKMFTKYDKMNGVLQENLVAVRVVKAFVRGKYEEEKFEDCATDVQNAARRAERVVIWNGPIMSLAICMATVLVLYFGGNQIAASDGKGIGELGGIISYTSQILMSLMMLSMIFITFVMSKASARRTVEILDEQIDITDESNDASVVVENGDIDFENVSFSYARNSENYVLKNINLHIKSGETVGIIGGTGSSKSTLVQLIPRLYDVSEGRILVGGVDVRDYKIDNLRKGVSMVLQKNLLFSGSIKDNLRWGDMDATDEEIEAACENAQAHGFITSFPEGYETDLGQGGVNVSGGQKQRLCIARAMLKKPKILILDDSTSAVDTATDAKIRSAFKNELKDTTKIIIAQRISSISEADKIIILSDGEINDVGTHDELIKRNEIYQEVYNSQQKGAQ